MGGSASPRTQKTTGKDIKRRYEISQRLKKKYHTKGKMTACSKEAGVGQKSGRTRTGVVARKGTWVGYRAGGNLERCRPSRGVNRCWDKTGRIGLSTKKWGKKR